MNAPTPKFTAPEEIEVRFMCLHHQVQECVLTKAYGDLGEALSEARRYASLMGEEARIHVGGKYGTTVEPIGKSRYVPTPSRCLETTDRSAFYSHSDSLGD
ncbi:MAG: hypothetical protein AAGI03_00635 [Pseudomonadota bacterium]